MAERKGQLTIDQRGELAHRCDMWAGLLGGGAIASIWSGEIKLSADFITAKEARRAHAGDAQWLRDTAKRLRTDPESGARKVDVLLGSVLAGYINFDKLVPID